MSAKREAVTTGSVIYPDPAKAILLTGAAGSLEQSRSGTLSANEAAQVGCWGACLWQVPVHRLASAMT